MRFFLYVQIPTEAGNDIVQDPNLLRNVEEYMNNVKAEAAYLYPLDCKRISPSLHSALFIISLQTLPLYSPWFVATSVRKYIPRL